MPLLVDYNIMEFLKGLIVYIFSIKEVKIRPNENLLIYAYRVMFNQ